MTFSLSLAGIPDAEAKRFGGARSFGSSSKHSKSYNRKASTPAKKTASQQKAHDTNQAARQSMSKRGGLMGMLGGLALGGLLGAMLFGGAFENLNMMDMLIFAGIAFLLFKLFAAKSKRQSPIPSIGRQRNNTDDLENQAYQRSNTSEKSSPGNNNAGFNTDVFANKGQTSKFSTAENQTESVLNEEPLILPNDFDEQDFLNGAKGAFKMLQSAWDQRDLAEIRSLTTDKVFADIQTQLQATKAKNQTDILQVEAELLEFRDLDNELEVVVLFDSLIREESSAQPEQVREVWTFIKPKNSLQPKWYLDGLQQLES